MTFLAAELLVVAVVVAAAAAEVVLSEKGHIFSEKKTPQKGKKMGNAGENTHVVIAVTVGVVIAAGIGVVMVVMALTTVGVVEADDTLPVPVAVPETVSGGSETVTLTAAQRVLAAAVAAARSDELQVFSQQAATALMNC